MAYKNYNDNVEWVPRTKLGKLVHKGEIRNMSEALNSRLPLRETGIVDLLLPDLADEVLNVNMVQRMTDSGRRVRFSVITVVGNNDGFVGLGSSKGKEVGPTIRKSIEVAKLYMIEVRRGCGSWECGCGTPHSLPFEVTGRCGSTRVTFRPAPRGVGLAVGDVAKHILIMAGIKDCWSFTQGQTRTTVNYAKAAFDALRSLAQMRVTESQRTMLNIHSGASNIAGDLPVDTEVVKEAVAVPEVAEVTTEAVPDTTKAVVPEKEAKK